MLDRCRRAVLVLAAAAMPAACIPYTSYPTSPLLEGRIEQRGQPVVAEMRAATGRSCERAVQETTSDEEGRFRLARTRRGWWHSPFVVYRLPPRDWTLCAGQPEGRDTAWVALLTVLDDGGMPARRLACELLPGDSPGGRCTVEAGPNVPAVDR